MGNPQGQPVPETLIWPLGRGTMILCPNDRPCALPPWSVFLFLYLFTYSMLSKKKYRFDFILLNFFINSVLVTTNIYFVPLVVYMVPSKNHIHGS